MGTACWHEWQPGSQRTDVGNAHYRDAFIPNKQAHQDEEHFNRMESR